MTRFTLSLVALLIFLAGLLCGIAIAYQDGTCAAWVPACLIVAAFNGGCLWRNRHGYV